MDKQCKEKTLQKRCEMIYLMCSFEGAILQYSSIAQSVEHAAVNRAVVGSSPTRGVYNYKNIVIGTFGCPLI